MLEYPCGWVGSMGKELVMIVTRQICAAAAAATALGWLLGCLANGMSSQDVPVQGQVLNVVVCYRVIHCPDVSIHFTIRLNLINNFCRQSAVFGIGRTCDKKTCEHAYRQNLKIQHSFHCLFPSLQFGFLYTVEQEYAKVC